jgi:hypothetical protein
LQLDDIRAELALRRLPQRIRESLTPEQEAAIRALLAARRDARPPLDVRLSVTLPWGRYFLALLAGPERRRARSALETRAVAPFPARVNGALFGVVAGVLGLMLLAALAVAGGALGR